MLGDNRYSGVYAEYSVVETFDGCGPWTFQFLEGLAEHQSKDWYEKNREVHQQHLQQPLGRLAESLSARLRRARIPLQGDRKSALFRLHRDVRFSKDKSPYKTNVGMILTRSGKKFDPGCLYVHVDPAGCFVAAGFYCPEPPVLGAFRTFLSEHKPAARKLVADLASQGLKLDQDERLIRTPKGFEHVDDPELLDLVKLKSFTVQQPVSRDVVLSRELEDVAFEFTRSALPLLKFGWKAIDAAALAPE